MYEEVQCQSYLKRRLRKKPHKKPLRIRRSKKRLQRSSKSSKRNKLNRRVLLQALVNLF